MAIRQLPKSFASRYGKPTITEVETDIFTKRYFTHCLSCRFCHDACCQHGVDVDLVHFKNIQAHAGRIEAYTGIPREKWFTGKWESEREYPGGRATRTRVVNGGCVFLNPKGRGCMIHSFCLENGIDYHELKSIIDCLFPLTFTDGQLCPASEVEDADLVCLKIGPSLYRGIRRELEYFFGHEFVITLDGIETEILAR